MAYKTKTIKLYFGGAYLDSNSLADKASGKDRFYDGDYLIVAESKKHAEEKLSKYCENISNTFCDVNYTRIIRLTKGKNLPLEKRIEILKEALDFKHTLKDIIR